MRSGLELGIRLSFDGEIKGKSKECVLKIHDELGRVLG